ncbi:MAG: hypothetical protein MJ102_01060 [Clostridia bacterium]|nr:hypothetical protein [Clostridia bacterium]
MRSKYFAASNCESGFVSYFNENLRGTRAQRCYIIKGGPGTGKSRLLGELADAAEQNGSSVEMYYCSSDPDSLDGIFVTLPFGGTVSVLDGTAPHSEDMKTPGSVDNIIDLGTFWDSAVLTERADDITKLNIKKAEAYSRGYRCLAAAGALRRAADSIVETCTDIEAVKNAAARVAAEFADVSVAPFAIRSPLEAISMRGHAEFDTFREGADKVFTVSDGRGLGTSYLFLGAVADAVRNRGGVCRISPDALCPDRIGALRIGKNAVVTRQLPIRGESDGVDMSEFFDRQIFRDLREEFSALRRLETSSMTAAYDALADAARGHFALEKIYSSAMNFKAKEEFCAGLCHDIFRRELYR